MRRQLNKEDDWLTREEASVTLIQRLFTGFETEQTVARDKARVDSAANRVFENAEFLALDAVGSYHEVLRQRELVNLSDKNVRIHIGIVDSIGEQLAGLVLEKRGPEPARVIPAARPLDLDYVRAQVAENLSAGRPRQDAGQVEDAEAAQGTGHGLGKPFLEAGGGWRPR